MENRLEIDAIMEHAKDVMRKSKAEHHPMFLLEGKEGVVIVQAEMTPDKKDELVETLKELVEKHSVTRYHLICSSWSVTSKSLNEKLRELAEELQQDKDVEKFMSGFASLRNSPSGNPAKVNVLLVQTFQKGQMSKTRMVEYSLTKKGVEFGEEKSLDGTSGWSRFNVWTPTEVNLDDEQGESDY